MIEENGWIVVRRQRSGRMLENAAGMTDEVILFLVRQDAEDTRDCMTCPRDWDIVPVTVREAAEGALRRLVESARPGILTGVRPPHEGDP